MASGEGGFDPPEPLASQILLELSDPDTPMSKIAERSNTTLDLFTCWLTRPDIAQRLATLSTAYAARATLQICKLLPAVAQSLIHSIQNHDAEESRLALEQGATGLPPPSGSPATDRFYLTDLLRLLDQRRRARESNRKAAWLLLRIARFDPNAHSRSPSRPEAPSEKSNSRSRNERLRGGSSARRAPTTGSGAESPATSKHRGAGGSSVHPITVSPHHRLILSDTHTPARPPPRPPPPPAPPSSPPA